MFKLVKRLFTEETGQGMVEYALIIALIAVVVMLALSPLGKAIKGMFEEVTDEISS